MNRLFQPPFQPWKPVPRTRGDEPASEVRAISLRPPFPARAGMNREPVVVVAYNGSVPRTRGDEPHGYAVGVVPLVRSPHARG